MKKRVFAFCILFSAFVLSLLYSCGTDGNTECDIEVVKDGSYYSDYSVEGETVTIRCRIVLKNKSDTAADFEIYGDFSSDKGSLLNEGVLKGTDAGSNGGSFALQPNEGKAFDVIFAGTFAGTYQKKERMLPEITIKTTDK